MLCSPCTDDAIQQGLDGTETVAEAVSQFPVVQVVAASGVATPLIVALPMCRSCRSKQASRSKSGLVTA